MPVDTCTPLCEVADLQNGAFADLAKAFDQQALSDIVIEATRACETEVSRRFVPFTLTESHRAEGIDPDELGGFGSGIPLDLHASLGTSYATALGSGTNLTRRCWLNEHAPLYPEMWQYSGVTVTVTASIGGSNVIQVLRGPVPDTGLLWFQLGTFIPIGSLIEVTYSGGYQTIPADLRRACKFMAASILCRELDPLGSRIGHNPADLEALAVGWLSAYARS